LVSASEASPPTLQKRGRILSRTEKARAPREPKHPPRHCKRGQEVALVSTPREPKRENSVLFLALVSASLVSQSLPPCTAKVGENSVVRQKGALVSTPYKLQRENSVLFLSIQSYSASVLNHALPIIHLRKERSQSHQTTLQRLPLDRNPPQNKQHCPRTSTLPAKSTITTNIIPPHLPMPQPTITPTTTLDVYPSMQTQTSTPTLQTN